MKLRLLLATLLFASLSFAQELQLVASGDQEYCPLSAIPIVTDFEIINPEATPVTSVYIQISEGYQRNVDQLNLAGGHPDISLDWDNATGKLTLETINNATETDLENAVKEVLFQSPDPNIAGSRVFSITTGQANFLASTGHYYEFVPALGISWTAARQEAENREYYGLQGYLATLTTIEEALLCGEQSTGAGWVGGTDQETEGIWKWVTGPEGLDGGLVFWRGGNSGFTPNFAYWNTNQPDNAHGGPGEDYVHITDPSVGSRGAWNDLRVAGDPPGVYHPKGYIVEYGGMPDDPVVAIATSTRINVPQIDEVFSASRCAPGEVTLEATSNTGSVYWFTGGFGGQPVHQGTRYTVEVTQTTDFYVAASIACPSDEREKITARIFEPLAVNNSVNLVNCQSQNSADGSAVFQLEEATPLITTDSSLSVDYFRTREDAENENGALTQMVFRNDLTDQVFARVTNVNGCAVIAEVNLVVSTTSPPDGFSHTLGICDDDGNLDGLHFFDLNTATSALLDLLPAGQDLELSYYRNEPDALLERNPIDTASDYRSETPYEQDIFVRIDNKLENSCFAVGPYVKLQVRDVPQFEVVDTGEICPEKPLFVIETFNAQEDYSYEWFDRVGNSVGTDPTLTVTLPGVYTVQATNDLGCVSNPKFIEIVPSGAANLETSNIDLIRTGDTFVLNIVNLETLGNGDYEFTLDDPEGIFTQMTRFDNIYPGTHTLFARDKKGCGLSSIEVFAFGFPKFFTPNNDGINDTWKPLGADPRQFKSIKTAVFDRFGKLIISLNDFQSSWDGKFGGINVPISGYWFKTTLVDQDGVVSEYRGHFSLRR